MQFQEIEIPAEFADICPITDKDFHNEISILLQEPAFRHIASIVLPEYTSSQLAQILLSLNTKDEFQSKVMKPFVEGIVKKTSDGLSIDGLDLTSDENPATFITNHRDIVLDSALLSYSLVSSERKSCEIAIGNNLLIYDWITKLVRLNKSFIVKRNLGRMQTLQAAIQLSKYIHFAITQKRTPVWIAQREGRCKDSNDRTQESLMKMLTYGRHDLNYVDSLKELNICPVAISYEYDPNDYLKAKEFLLKSKNPNYKKTQQDDLDSMQTGIMGYKGKIHFQFTPSINSELEEIPEDLDKLLTMRFICSIIDQRIHLGYKIFKTNYMAHDMLFDDHQFAEHYTQEDLDQFKSYVSGQIDRVKGITLTEFDRYYMYMKILQMYSNPLTNQLEAMK